MALVAWSSAALLLPMLVCAVYNLFTAPRLERTPEPVRRPAVSLLVPARNESENLFVTLPALLALDYTPLEIIVLDDCSEDDTAAMVEAAAALAPGRLRLMHGAPLPAGWLGKTWACQQLADAAAGELLVFCDADVAPRPDAVTRTVALLETTGAAAATAIPRQRLRGWWADAVIPLVVQLPVLALLPIRLVQRTTSPSLSMANGQWLALEETTYRAIGGHQPVRAERAEDVAIGRRVKAAGFGLSVAIGAESLEVRMYADAPDMRSGFARTVYPLVGARPLGLALGVVLFSLATVAPWLLLAFDPGAALVPLLLLLGIRTCGALVFRHGPLSVALHPLGSLLLLFIAAESFLRASRGTLVWKGRTLERDSSAEGLA